MIYAMIVFLHHSTNSLNYQPNNKWRSGNVRRFFIVFKYSKNQKKLLQISVLDSLDSDWIKSKALISTTKCFHFFKVHIFWEGHKILQNLPLTFDCMYCSQKLGEDFRKILWPSQNIWTLIRLLVVVRVEICETVPWFFGVNIWRQEKILLRFADL